MQVKGFDRITVTMTFTEYDNFLSKYENPDEEVFIFNKNLFYPYYFAGAKAEVADKPVVEAVFISIKPIDYDIITEEEVRQ